jgi:ERI1 exoribonuclease 3
MAAMLQEAGLELIGRHHSGLDDCKNIARILRFMLDRGYVLAVTGKTG